MASRLLYGAKAHKRRDEEEEKRTAEQSTGATSKRLSTIPRPTNTSKIPSHTTSLFSRSKSNLSDENSSTRGRKPLVSQARPVEHMYRETSSEQRSKDSPASGISRSLGLGLNLRSEVSSIPTSTKSAPVPRNRLRRKPSSIDQRSRYAQSESSKSSYDPVPPPRAIETASSPGGYADPFPGSILGISIPAVSSSTSKMPTVRSTPTAYATSSSRMAQYMSSKPPPNIYTQDLPPPLPTPTYAGRSSSTSTRCSESPGPFSRTSTPTSISSHSPGIVLPPKFSSRLGPQLSPTRSRPPVTRRKVGGPPQTADPVDSQGLTALRESQTSSSSSSTVKAPESNAVTGSTQTSTRTKSEHPQSALLLRSTSRRLPKLSTLPRDGQHQDQAQTGSRDQDAFTSRMQQPVSSLTKIPTSTSSLKLPPQRPSREGTPSLFSQSSSPVIQSNMSHLATTGHKRRESMEKAVLASPSKVDGPSTSRQPLVRSDSINSNSSKKKVRLPSPGTTGRISPHLYSQDKPQARETRPLKAELHNKLSKRDPSPTVGGPAKSPSRFGLFSRKAKPSLEASTAAPSERPAKKGPAAGTGHEGYGKYARRGRGGSASTSASRGRSSSTDRTSMSGGRPTSSRKSSFAGESKPQLDDFYKERLEPVVIGGGGKVKENRNSGASLYRLSSAESSVSMTSSADFSPRYGMMPQKIRRQDDDFATGKPDVTDTRRDSRTLLPAPELATPRNHDSYVEVQTLAHRRSLHRSQLFKEAEPLKIPQPINTRTLEPSPSLDSRESEPLSVPPTGSTFNRIDDLSEGHEGNWLKPRKAQEKIKQPRKWNFFQRAHHSPKKAVFPDYMDEVVDSQESLASSTKPLDFRSVAHYAMLDSSEQEDPESLEDLLRVIEDDLDLRKRSRTAAPLAPTSATREREYSMLLPSPPKFPATFTEIERSSSPKVFFNQPSAPQEPIPTPIAPETVVKSKEPRLQQIGRIPRVVSKRDRLHRPPPQSFSRPFARKPTAVAEPTSAVEAIEAAVPVDKPVLALQTQPLPSAPFAGYNFGKPASAPPTNGMLFNLDGEKEFLSLSPRKGSEVSGSSSSGIMSFTAMNAILPTPESVLSEDEVWNEYDELLDHVASPASVVPGSPDRDQLLNSFPSLSKLRSREAPPSGKAKQESPVIVKDRSSGSTTISATSPLSPPPQRGLPVRPDILELPSPHRSEAYPLTPMSFSEIYAGYGNRSSAGITPNRQSTTSGSRYSSQTMISRSGSSSSSEHAKRYTRIMAEKTRTLSNSPDNLRFTALMASRWLSFDRVLFSPVSEEIRANRQDRVLVLDGLGNDDWSSYCAFTYPSATVYNLSSSPSSSKLRDSSSTTSSSTWQPPSNHRQILHPSIAHPFPFPKSFFTAVVFRFPTANSESAYRNAISECKRVLRPGGYLEMSILDMDMVNMGNRARRAVRGLKVRMQVAHPEVSLSPVSDGLQKLLGRRGFENLNRCFVGVPVGRSVPDSPAPASSPSNQDPFLAYAAPPPFGGDINVDATSGQPDLPMTKMLAKVGRWWWSRCYETGVVAEGDKEGSIWADRQLLKECEKWGTGLRMCVCYAQKPEGVRRRTVSV